MLPSGSARAEIAAETLLLAAKLDANEVDVSQPSSRRHIFRSFGTNRVALRESVGFDCVGVYMVDHCCFLFLGRDTNIFSATVLFSGRFTTESCRRRQLWKSRGAGKV